MDEIDRITAIFICILIVIIGLWFVSWMSINNRVNNAKTPEELKIACQGLSVQNAPVNCTRIIK